jgi:hypothetical protein
MPTTTPPSTTSELKILMSLGQNNKYVEFFNSTIILPLWIAKSQCMKCVVCYGVQQKNVRQNSTHHYKGLVMYNKNCEIIAMCRHVF